MPFVVVITAAVIVNNSDDNARCFVSGLLFCCLSVALPKQALLAEELPVQLRRDTALTSQAALCYCESLSFLYLKLQMQTSSLSSFNKVVDKRALVCVASAVRYQSCNI